VVDFKPWPFCEQEAGWARQVVWTSWRREKPFASTDIRAPDRLVRSVVGYATPARDKCILFQKKGGRYWRSWRCLHFQNKIQHTIR